MWGDLVTKPRKRKPASEMTNDELAKRVFPPEVHEHLKRLAHESESKKFPQKKSN